jgi:DNA polymerase-3 subunit epsilon
MSLLDARVAETAWAAIDFESAGAAPGRSDEPVQVGLAVWRWGHEAPGNFFRSQNRSDRRITRTARAVHGISDADVAAAPEMGSLWPEFRQRLAGAVVLAHGAGTEKRFLRSFPLHGFGPWVDTLGMARALLPGLPDHGLGTVIAALDLEERVRTLCPGLAWHDALFDAVACLVFLQHVVSVLDLGSARVGQLQNLDAEIYRRRRSALGVARSAGWRDEA